MADSDRDSHFKKSERPNAIHSFSKSGKHGHGCVPITKCSIERNSSDSSPSSVAATTDSVFTNYQESTSSDRSIIPHPSSISNELHADSPRAKFWYEIKCTLIEKTKHIISRHESKKNPYCGLRLAYDLCHSSSGIDTAVCPLDPLLYDESWVDMIDLPYKDYYHSLYEDMKDLTLDEKIRAKVSLDTKRTFSLFTSRSCGSLEDITKSNLDEASNLPLNTPDYLLDSFRSFIEFNNDTGEVSNKTFESSTIGKYEEALSVILSIVSHERGYCQGSNFIAGLFLVKERGNVKNAFLLLSYLLRQCHLEMLYYSRHIWSTKKSLKSGEPYPNLPPQVAIRCRTMSSLSHAHWQPDIDLSSFSTSISYKSKMSMTTENGNTVIPGPQKSSSSSFLYDYITHFELAFRHHNPLLYEHLQNMDFPAVCYAVEWFTTCFVKTCPGDFCTCVLDLIFLGVDDAFVRVGLAILDFLQDKLMGLDGIGLQIHFKPMVRMLRPHDVIPIALLIDLYRLGEQLEGRNLNRICLLS